MTTLLWQINPGLKNPYFGKVKDRHKTARFLQIHGNLSVKELQNSKLETILFNILISRRRNIQLER